MKRNFVNIPVPIGHEALQARLKQLREESARRLSQLASNGKSNLTFNDLTFLLVASQASLAVLVRDREENMRPENWSRIELARTTPSFIRVQHDKEAAERIKGLRLAIRRAKATLENA